MFSSLDKKHLLLAARIHKLKWKFKSCTRFWGEFAETKFLNIKFYINVIKSMLFPQVLTSINQLAPTSQSGPVRPQSVLLFQINFSTVLPNLLTGPPLLPPSCCWACQVITEQFSLSHLPNHINIAEGPLPPGSVLQLTPPILQLIYTNLWSLFLIFALSH